MAQTAARVGYQRIQSRMAQDKIKTACKNFLLGKVEKPKASVKKSKPAHQGVKGIDQVACATFLQELSSDLTFMM